MKSGALFSHLFRTEKCARNFNGPIFLQRSWSRFRLKKLNLNRDHFWLDDPVRIIWKEIFGTACMRFHDWILIMYIFTRVPPFQVSCSCVFFACGAARVITYFHCVFFFPFWRFSNRKTLKSTYRQQVNVGLIKFD